MFYDIQSEVFKQDYRDFLKIVGELSKLFSTSDSPYLPYRAHENLFCRCFQATNLARADCSADAITSDRCGVGLKTWVGNDDQKVAEFGRLRPQYKDLTGLELVMKIAEFRNLRIKTTINTYGLRPNMIYHVVKRVPGYMKIFECQFDLIDIDNIKLIKTNSPNNVSFEDGKHRYHFSLSKNTLYMKFDDMVELDSIPVDILDDPYAYLMELNKTKLTKFDSVKEDVPEYSKKPQLCLRLYSNSSTRGAFVPDKSGLNQWNGYRSKRVILPDGTEEKQLIPRNPLEVYIPYPKVDRDRSVGFFPPRDKSFALHLPDGKIISAKLCQAESKAIMSSPNKDLGQWILRTVLELPEGKVVTYEMLEAYGIDCVVFTKNCDDDFSIDFGSCGTYESMLGNSRAIGIEDED